MNSRKRGDDMAESLGQTACMSSSDALTQGIRVRVRCHYLAQQSQPEQGRWLFAYTIRISNEGEHPAQLLSRHWIIEDAEGHIEEVEGPGVVGCQPKLAPGESFEYTSYCPLPTPTGRMRGSYEMVTEDLLHFDAEVAEFRLDAEFDYN